MVTNTLTHWFQLFERALLNSAFPFVVDNPGTLLCLLRAVSADFDKRIDHMFECVHIVVEHYQVKHF